MLKSIQTTVIFVFAAVSTAFSQNTSFQHVFATPQADFASCFVQTPDGGYLLGGGVVPGDGTLLLTDASGQIAWQRQFPTSFTIERVASASDSGFWALGALNAIGPNDDYLVLYKIDPLGQVLWSRSWQYPINDGFYQELLSIPGGCVVSIFGVDDNLNSAAFRIDNDGMLRWHKSYNADLSIQHLDGNTLFASGRRFDAACMALIDLDSGDPVSAFLLDGALGNESLRFLAPTADGDLALADYAHGGIQDLRTWMLKISRNGVLRWSKRLTVDGDLLNLYRFRSTPDSGLLLAGSINGRGILVKSDQAGELLWGYHYNGAFFGNPVDAYGQADGGAVALGVTTGPDGSLGANLWLFRTEQDGTIATCPAQPLSVEAQAYPLTVSPLAVQAVDQAGLQIFTLGSVPVNLLVSLPFCGNPPVYSGQEIALCPNDTFFVGGLPYTAPATVTDTLTAVSGADSIITYTLTISPYTYQTEFFLLQPGETVLIGGVAYTAPASVRDTLPAISGCDTVVTWLLRLEAAQTEPTFLKTYGALGVSEGGYTLCPSGDGNLYVAGLKDKRTFILKINPAGVVLWERSFVVNPFEPVIPSDLMSDSEGMLVGCGTTGFVFGLHKGFVFRYNPATNTLLWTQSIVSYRPQSAGLLEKSPGGNYLYHQAPQPGNTLESEWLELDRLTGAVVPPLAKRYRYQNNFNLKSAVLHKGALYGTGTSWGQYYAPTEHSLRHALIKTNLPDGAPEWTYLSHVDTADLSVYQSGNCIIADGDTLVSVGNFGQKTPSGGFSEGGVILQKNTLDGALVWVRRYANTGSANAVIRFGEGYVIAGERSTNSQFILCVDREGFPLWTKTLELNFSSSVSFSDNNFQDNLVALGDYLYLVTPVDPQGNNDVYLLKMDANGNVDGGCDFLKPLAVTMTPVLNPLNTAIEPVVANSPATASATVVPVVQGQLPDTLLCPVLLCDPLPEIQDTLAFCPCDTLTLNGISYTSPAIHLDTLPGLIGNCYTLVTTVLRFLTDNQPSVLTISCPPDQVVTTASGAATVLFNEPDVLSDCICPGVMLAQTAGLPSGSSFPTGLTTVCFLAEDRCGASASCCFQVDVQEMSDPGAPCDIKENGCVRFELLRISRDPFLRQTFHFRIVNQCPQALTYAAFQIPDGVTALAPANNAAYTAPGGRVYATRNPNFSPFYSVRFIAQDGGIAPGQSDEFRYTLPPQADPLFIHAVVRPQGQGFVETHLNTFGCPVVDEAPKPSVMVQRTTGQRRDFLLFPNPTAGALFADLSAWLGQTVQLRVLNAQGQMVHMTETVAEIHTAVALPEGLVGGLYWLSVYASNGERQMRRFVLNR